MLKLIKTEVDYDNALARIYQLIQLDIEPDTTLGDELEVLSVLVKAYEDAHYPMPKPNPIDAIRFRLEQMNFSETELSKLFGRSRKSEILSGKRKLSLGMIRKLNTVLKIPAEILIKAY